MICNQFFDQRIQFAKSPGGRKHDLLFYRKVNLDLGLKLLRNLHLPVCQFGVVNRHGPLDAHTQCQSMLVLP